MQNNVEIDNITVSVEMTLGELWSLCVLLNNVGLADNGEILKDKLVATYAAHETIAKLKVGRGEENK